MYDTLVWQERDCERVEKRYILWHSARIAYELTRLRLKKKILTSFIKCGVSIFIFEPFFFSCPLWLSTTLHRLHWIQLFRVGRKTWYIKWAQRHFWCIRVPRTCLHDEVWGVEWKIVLRKCTITQVLCGMSTLTRVFFCVCHYFSHI